MPHADDIAALRRLLEGVEGFAERMGWRRVIEMGRFLGYIPEDGRLILADGAGTSGRDIDRAVGVAMEMLPAGYKVWSYTWGKKRGWQGEDGERTRSSPRLLPLLADVLCGGRDDGH